MCIRDRDNIFEYMVEVCINGNFSSFRRLYHELNKEARKDFIAFLILDVYKRQILNRSPALQDLGYQENHQCP